MREMTAEYNVDCRVMDLPSRMRPRELIDRVGVENAPDDALIAVLLRSGVKGTSVVKLSHDLLRTYGSLTELAKAPVEELGTAPGMGPVKAQILKAALEIARRLGEESSPRRQAVRTPEDAARLLRSTVRTLDHEVFWVLGLDAKNQLNGMPEVVSHGLLDASLVHAREVFRRAIRTGCAGVVLAHNHPSGDPAPSAEDVRITRSLVEAGRIIDIRVLDHVILGRKQDEVSRDFFSFRESGTLSFD